MNTQNVSYSFDTKALIALKSIVEEQNTQKYNDLSVQGNVPQIPNKAKLRHDSPKGHNGTVDPIKDERDIQAAKQYFLNQPLRYQNSKTNIRNYTLFVLGLNTGRRIGDILNLTIGDFFNSNLTLKQHLTIKEQKTGKRAKLLINDSVKQAIVIYVNSLDKFELSDPLFPSRQKDKEGNKKAIGYNMALTIYKQMAKEIGLTDKGLNIGTHSCRKTLGYKFMQQSQNNPMALAQLQNLYNHSNSQITLRYIGLTQEDQDNMMQSINL